MRRSRRGALVREPSLMRRDFGRRWPGLVAGREADRLWKFSRWELRDLPSVAEPL